MQPPSVVIAANPYEAELCRRALVETGLRVVAAEGGEGTVELLASERPLVLVLALGLFGVEPLELLQKARAQFPSLPIFLIGDRDGEVPDEDAAALLGATRLFLRPIDSDSLADAIEKRAVEAEVAEEVSEAMAEFSVRPPTIDAAPLVEESIVELEAEWEPDARSNNQPVARIALRKVTREPTEVVGAVERVRARAGEIDSGVARADDSGPPDTHAPSLPVEPPAPNEAAATAEAESEGTATAETAAEIRPIEVTLPAPLPRGVTEVLSPPSRVAPAGEGPAAGDTMAPPPSVALPDGGTRPRIFGEPRRAEPDPLLRADDALADAAGLGLHAMAGSPDFVPGDGTRPAEPRRDERKPFDERSTLARRLESELSAAERRLFPDSPSSTSAPSDDPYEDALGDIDLDKLGIDTIPGVGGDAFEALRPRNGHGSSPDERGVERGVQRGEPAEPPAAHDFLRTPTLPRAPVAALPDDEGDLAARDVATLLAQLHAAGFSGRLDLTRADGDKALFFDGGLPVFAASSFGHDRLAELLYRDGKVTREQLARTRALPDGGRLAAQKLVELGLIKSSELFATLRHHLEEIVYSLFAWDRGRYRLSGELAAPEDRVRLGASLWALLVEGVRRKYGLERLVELVGPPEVVLSPTVNLERALAECGLTPAERARAEALDGERSLAELALGGGAPLSEAGLYALAWSLVAVGAARIGSDDKGELASGLPTLVTSPESAADRRGRPRPAARARDREQDRAVDKERVLAKRAQIDEGDYFAVLGLSRDAGAHEIARACERLKREFAPDRFAESVRGELGDALAEIAEVLDEAQRVLGDDEVRRAYRAQLPPTGS